MPYRVNSQKLDAPGPIACVSGFKYDVREAKREELPIVNQNPIKVTIHRGAGANEFVSCYDISLELKLIPIYHVQIAAGRSRDVHRFEAVAQRDYRRLEKIIVGHYGRQSFTVPEPDLNGAVDYFKRLLIYDALQWAGSAALGSERLGMARSHFRELRCSEPALIEGQSTQVEIKLGTYKGMQHSLIEHFARLALARNQGKVIRAAQFLGVPRANLQRWMNILGINKDYYMSKRRH